jgi:hypothetical protein
MDGRFCCSRAWRWLGICRPKAVTTKHFLSAFGMEILRDLPDVEALEDAGLLSRRVVQNKPLSTEAESEED